MRLALDVRSIGKSAFLTIVVAAALTILTSAAAAQEAPATQPQPSSTAASEQHLERQRAFAKARIRQDNRRFPQEQVDAAEALYQIASKNWRSDEARASVKTLIAKYPELNRTGCAVLNLGQWCTGAERERYLKRAAEEYGDCFYRNGVQIGAYARYLLGHHYREQGKTADAERIFDEIRKSYPEAITPSGEVLVAVLREEAKGTRKPDTTTQPAADDQRPQIH
ncbi:MAG TPA: hypothetical protein VGR35_10605 [Tepidisphaeraceae bacterium]|nr:hypothetical protein [Tepidisphaeraceae bacterium]